MQNTLMDTLVKIVGGGCCCFTFILFAGILWILFARWKQGP